LSEQLEREVSAEQLLREQNKSQAPTPDRPVMNRIAPPDAHTPLPHVPLPQAAAEPHAVLADGHAADAGTPKPPDE
jgi:hypothetical protein